MDGKMYMSAEFWRQVVRVSHLQKSIRTFVFEKEKPGPQPDTASYVNKPNMAFLILNLSSNLNKDLVLDPSLI